MDDSAIIQDEVIESHNEEKNFNEKKAICKIQNSCQYLLLFEENKKYYGKHLLPFHNTNNKSNKFYIDRIN